MSDPSAALVLLRSQTAAGSRYLVTWQGILIWDWLSMLPVEYEHIWKPKKTLFTTVFLLNRYGTIFFSTVAVGLILSNIPEDVCSKLFWLQPLCLIWVFTTVDALLALRVWAIYARRPGIGLALFVLIFTECSILVAAATRERGLTIPEPVASYIDSYGCFAVDKPGAAILLDLAYSMVPCVVNSVLLSLTIFRSWRVTRKLEGAQPPIFKRMVNDGILYFLCITVVTTLNIYFYVQPNRSIKLFNLCATVVVSSTLSCRLALSLFVRSPGSIT